MRDANIETASDARRRAVETAGDVAVGLCSLLYGLSVAAFVLAVLWLRWGW